jgi:hypothetical protein
MVVVGQYVGDGAGLVLAAAGEHCDSDHDDDDRREDAEMARGSHAVPSLLSDITSDTRTAELAAGLGASSSILFIKHQWMPLLFTEILKVR